MHIDKTDKCEVCIVLKNFQSADIPLLAIEISSLDFYFTPISPNDYNITTYLNKGYYSTAPPRYSFI